jgi:hypothetical protein
MGYIHRNAFKAISAPFSFREYNFGFKTTESRIAIAFDLSNS